jgi:hypothetical protein
MVEVVRLFFAIVCRRIALVAGLLLVTVSVHAQAPSQGINGFKSVTSYHANAKFITFARFVQTKVAGAPDSTPTFSTAQPLLLVAATDFVTPDEAGNDKDRAKLKGEVKAPQRDKPTLPSNVPIATDPNSQFGEKAGFQWRSAWQQSLMFLGMQHAFRMATESGSRADLKGPFFKDYFATLKNLAAWDDGDPFIVNYIGHPMMGSVTGYIQIQNDPRGINQELGLNKSYWKSRLKAFGWSFVYSTQFELGPLSEAAIGNVGIRPYKGHKHPMAYVDLVVTPVVGTAWLVGEDALDKYLIRQLDRHVKNRVAHVLLRSFLNPTRSLANVLRGKYPWYRDDRGY